MRNRLQTGRHSSRGFSLIEIVVVVVLMVALGGALMTYYVGKGGGKKGDVVHTPISRTNDVVCQTNLGSVRQSITAFSSGDTDGKPPASLDEMRELTSELKSCPVGHEPYQYDPSTGQVHCVHPGHENY